VRLKNTTRESHGRAHLEPQNLEREREEWGRKNSPEKKSHLWASVGGGGEDQREFREW
jgi:hypothetical protein